MSSTKLTRTLQCALGAGALIAITGLTPASAIADPRGSSPADQFEQLSAQADRLNEQINNATVDLAGKRADLAKANADLATTQAAETIALAKEKPFRAQVDQLMYASFQGAGTSQLSALLTGTSLQDYLDKADYLRYLAEDRAAVLRQFTAAANDANTAEARAAQDQRTAQDATSAAQALLGQLDAQRSQLRQQIQQVDAALGMLPASQRLALATDTGPQGSYIAPAGIAGRAMEIALAQRGKTYVYGGAGPTTFDCSGLIAYAYAQAGKPGIPHSAAAQQTLGIPVSKADLQPGDLVFFGSPAYHDGIYVGNGMMVNAPHTGTVVRVEPLFSGYSGARRLGA
ncbi:MAG TPA: NlpC/P60 family protein [Pseudonocardiaceae bacterium]|nr:NlpC/P60 family protein [Pseudonocardiaceae bacterium]